MNCPSSLTSHTTTHSPCAPSPDGPASAPLALASAAGSRPMFGLLQSSMNLKSPPCNQTTRSVSPRSARTSPDALHVG
eukprot:1071838-Rhodomonas_salina.7